MLRRTTSAPARRCGAIWSTAFSKIVIDGPEELVDRRADDDDHCVGAADHRRVGARTSAGRSAAARQELVGARLQERHLARGDPVQGGLVGVVYADAQAGLGESEAERQADVAAATEDDDVEVRRPKGSCWQSSSPVRTVTGAR